MSIPIVEIVAGDVLFVMIMFLSVFTAPVLEPKCRTRPVHPISGHWAYVVDFPPPSLTMGMDAQKMEWPKEKMVFPVAR